MEDIVQAAPLAAEDSGNDEPIDLTAEDVKPVDAPLGEPAHPETASGEALDPDPATTASVEAPRPLNPTPAGAGERQEATPESLQKADPDPSGAVEDQPVGPLSDAVAGDLKADAAGSQPDKEASAFDLPPATEVVARLALASGTGTEASSVDEEPLPLEETVDPNRAEALQKQKAARVKAAELKQQKLTRAKAEAVKKKKMESAKERQQKTGLPQPLAPKPPSLASSPNSRMVSLLKKYKGQAIGINYDNSADIRKALLLDANEEYFSVAVAPNKLQFSFPLKTVLTVVEGPDGVEISGSGDAVRYPAVIKVYPLVLF
jgi:hypothetical protein